jgi:ParB-like chromosome segregation protein Spo0J
MDRDDLTASRAGEKIGRSRSWVAQKLRLLSLPDTARELIRAGQLSEAHGRQLLKLESADLGGEIGALGERAAAESWTVARLEAAVNLALARPGAEPEPRAEPLAGIVGALIAAAFRAGQESVLRHMGGGMISRYQDPPAREV